MLAEHPSYAQMQDSDDQQRQSWLHVSINTLQTGGQPLAQNDFSPHGGNIQEHRLRGPIKGEAGEGGLDHEHGGLHGLPLQGQPVEGSFIWRVVEDLHSR